jgi:acetylornithine deacetylase/succinyl-diaminopimelate desuccinylase-like protein
LLGDGDYEIAFSEAAVGNGSSHDTKLMDLIKGWVETVDPDAIAIPSVLPGFTDSRWFRKTFPDCVAYGFFPHRHQSLLDAAPLVHGADERIDVRDLGWAAQFYADVTRTLLG